MHPVDQADTRHGIRAPRSSFDRSVSLERLGREHFDVLVIGGGITGCGVALEAAARGLRTALVEQSDFASGTSSKSSKLVHGGLRYLAQHDFGLVHESLAERQRLLENAPHLVSPLQFAVPLFRREDRLDRAVARGYESALAIYDLFGGWRMGQLRHRLGAEELADALPALDRDGLSSGFRYQDATADDARLTLAIARTAALGHGATLANYVRVVGIGLDANGLAATATVVPILFAAGPQPCTDGDPIEVHARCIVNATGVAADRVQAMGGETNRLTLRPAKGVHLSVPSTELEIELAAVLPVEHDRRSIFVIPWRSTTYFGTTDTDDDGPLDDPSVTAADAKYLLDAVNAHLRTPIHPRSITGAWAGLRPLLAPLKSPSRHRSRTMDLSRRHRVVLGTTGIVTVTGGKLTTYRKMASDTLDVVDAALCRSHRASPTTHLRLRGATSFVGLDRPGTAEALGVDPLELRRLLRRYGGEALSVLELARSTPELARPAVDGLDYLCAEAVFAARYEMAQCLDDVLSRRTRARIERAAASARAASSIAGVLAPELGWDRARVEREVDHYQAAVAHDLEGLEALCDVAPASGAR
jgi:glycerol-3-phosphate dehydrogenase